MAETEKITMENIALSQFVQLQGVDNAMILLVTNTGEGGKVTPQVLTSALTTAIRPSINPTTKHWFIGTADTDVVAIGYTPELRKVDGSIEWKYTNEGNTSWRPLVALREIRFEFDELTDAQKDQLTLHFKDLTPDDIKALQKPAADMIALVDAHDKAYTVAEKARVDAESKRVQDEQARAKAESQREADFANAQYARQLAFEQAEVSRESAENGRKQAESLREQAEDRRVTAFNDAQTARQRAFESAESERERRFVESRNEADRATAAANTAAANTNQLIDASTAQTELAKELNEHQPRVVNRQWQIWDSDKKAYVDSGQPSYCPSPYISNINTWMVWDETQQKFVDSHVSVSTDITREQILSMVPDVVLTGEDIATVSDDDAIRAALA